MVATLLIVAVSLGWHREVVSTLDCEPYLCDWVRDNFIWGRSSCGYCDNNTNNCYWTPVVNGYEGEAWGAFPFGSNGPMDVCPPPIGPSGYPFIYYAPEPPYLNGTTCYKPSGECEGEDWITDYVRGGGNCSPIISCIPSLVETYKTGRVTFIIVTSILVSLISIVSCVNVLPKKCSRDKYDC
jgi:hypothetical protein